MRYKQGTAPSVIFYQGMLICEFRNGWANVDGGAEIQKIIQKYGAEAWQEREAVKGTVESEKEKAAAEVEPAPEKKARRK